MFWLWTGEGGFTTEQASVSAHPMWTQQCHRCFQTMIFLIPTQTKQDMTTNQTRKSLVCVTLLVLFRELQILCF